MLSALVLAAGFGTRLRPLSDERPKPLCPVGDRTALAHVIEGLAKGGVERVVVNTHHLAEAFDAATLGALPLPTTVLHEPHILGTAGGLRNAAWCLGQGDVVVWNGDILVEVDVGALLLAHRAQNALATLVLTRRARGEGTVGVGADGRVVRLRGERFGEESAGGDFVGVQTISSALRAALPEEGCLVGDVYLPALRAGRTLHTFAIDGPFSDIGNLGAYLDANLAWLAARGLGSFVAPDAHVAEGVTLDGCVIGAHARVDGLGVLRRVVVWPDAVLEAPRAGGIATPRGWVPVS